MNDEQRLNRALDLIYSMRSVRLLYEVERAAVNRISAVEQQRDQEEQELDFNWDYLSS